MTKEEEEFNLVDALIENCYGRRDGTPQEILEYLWRRYEELKEYRGAITIEVPLNVCKCTSEERMTSIETRPNKDQLKPTGDWLLVEPVEVSDVSEGGILMPAHASTAVDAYGKVLKTGPGYFQNGKRIPPGVEAGQIIMFRKGRGIEMRFSGDKVLWMTERDLLAVVG